MDLEILITDNLIKFHASNWVGLFIFIWLVSASILNGLNIRLWFLKRKIAKLEAVPLVRRTLAKSRKRQP